MRPSCLREPHNPILRSRLEAICCSKTAVEQTCAPEVDATIVCVKTDLRSHIDCKTDNEVLKFYWELGRDIVSMDADNKYGSGFYKCLSNDLKEELPGVDGLSPSNLRYTKRFYLLYNELVGNFQQLAENLFSVPWGHHLFLIDKCSNDAIKAYYYVRQTVENAWSRAMLENFYDTNLFERERVRL